MKMYVTLNNGIKIPQIGFGTYRIPDGNDAINTVQKALEIGYRHLDCASAYDNQAGVGEGIHRSGIKRSELFITGKVWVTDMEYDATMKAFEKTIKELRVDYLDLYIIHWPKPNSRTCYKALQELYNQKLVRAIGISNFLPHHIEEMIKGESIAPAVNQIECHPYLHQNETLEYCKKENIKVTAHTPFRDGRVFKDPVLKEIAEKHGKTVAQVVLSWHMSRGIIVIPKSVTPSRIKENFDSFGFVLDQDDLDKITALETGERFAPHPDNMPF